MTRKVGRPREKHVSKWGYWKREQRANKGKRSRCANCGKPATDTHHRDGRQSNSKSSNKVRLCRSCHTKIGNRAGHNRRGG